MTIVSVIRLESLIVFANTTNLTCTPLPLLIHPSLSPSTTSDANVLVIGDYVRVGYWSTIEIHVGVICACLPALRSLLRRLWPSAFGDTAKGTGTANSKGVSGGTGTGNGTGQGLSHSRKSIRRDDEFVLLEMGDNKD